MAMMDSNSRQLLLPTTCQKMKQNADCQLQHVLLMLKPLLPMHQLITNDKSVCGLQQHLLSKFKKCTPPLSYIDSMSNYAVLTLLAPALSMSTSILGDKNNNNSIDLAANNDKICMLLLLPSFIDRALSTTSEEHFTTTRMVAASCLYSICILMQSNNGDDANVNDFMNDVILDPCLFSSLEIIIANSSNAAEEDNGDFLVKGVLHCASFLVAACPK